LKSISTAQGSPHQSEYVVEKSTKALTMFSYCINRNYPKQHKRYKK